MRSETFREFIERLWNSAVTTLFSDGILFAQLTSDGGHDAIDASLHLITDLLDEQEMANFHAASFACSETLAYYLALNDQQQLSAQQIVCAVFAAMVLSDSCRSNVTDWSFEHEKILSIIQIFNKRIQLEDLLYVMCYIYGKTGKSLIG